MPDQAQGVTPCVSGSTAVTDDGRADTTEVTVELVVDEITYQLRCAASVSALRAIRELAGHPRPRRGCQEGICGKCESLVNGVETRLCTTPIGALDGAVVVTPTPRRSIWS